MDEPQLIKRFTEHGAPGAYLRVVAEGTVGAGDEIEVVHRPDHGVTIGEVFVIRRADAEDGLLPDARDAGPARRARRQCAA